MYILFSIFDRVSKLYSEPFLAPSIAVAVRRFNYLMSQTPMVSGDCQLYSLGSFDTETGSLSSLEKPEFICNYEVLANG